MGTGTDTDTVLDEGEAEKAALDADASEIAREEARQQEESALYETVSAALSRDGRVMLSEDVEIFPNKPIPALDYENVRAFEAKDKRALDGQVAYVCEREAIPRIGSISSYRHLKNANILRLYEAAVVQWPTENRQLFAFVFDSPPAKRFLPTSTSKPYKLSEDKIISTLLQPLVSVLSDLRNVDLVHGAINARNLFFSGAEGAETAFLGECLTSAAFLRQEVLFEPIERALAQSTGRGRGAYKDDIYALGVCVAMAARGENLLLNRTDEDIIQGKLNLGSYGFIVGRERMPSGITECLRGLLHDDEAQRWDVDEAMRWLEGRRSSPKQPRVNWQAARPFNFCGQKYRNLRTVAHAFSKNITDAAVVTEQDQFDLWVKRNFEDKELHLRLEAIWDKERGGNKERLVSSVCMVLDPYAPVRYKELSLLPAGLGIALAKTMFKGEEVQVYGEIISEQLFNNWVGLRFDEIADASGILARFDKCRNYLHQKLSGYGMERVLYTLSRDCVCLSTVLSDYFVIGPGGLLQALEKTSQKANRPEAILDRHMIAFLSVREPKSIDPFLGYVTSPDSMNQIIGILRCLATIQFKFHVGAVPGVSNWLADLLLPVINRFYDLDLRDEIKRQLVARKNSGDLRTLLELVDDYRVVQEDLRRFTRARMEHTALVKEKERIDYYMARRKSFGYATGRQVSMVVSSVLSFMFILGYLILYFTRSIN